MTLWFVLALMTFAAIFAVMFVVLSFNVIRMRKRHSHRFLNWRKLHAVLQPRHR
mgnify:CR=1 FL=1